MSNVLIVDDNETMDAFRSLLKPHKVTMALNGQEGLEALLKDSFDIIFCDFEMPIMNGYEFTKQAKEKYPNIPIIGIGSFPDNMQEHLEICREKPFSYTELLEDIEIYTTPS